MKRSELQQMTNNELEKIANASPVSYSRNDIKKAQEVLYERLKYPENVEDYLTPEENYNGKREEI